MTSVPLRLDLVRHGEAEPAGEGGDGARRLSPAGRHTITELSSLLTLHGWRPTAIWASPLVRAQETAAILMAHSRELSIGTLFELMPDGEPDDVIEALLERSAEGHVVLVGHQPLMGRLVAWLTGAPERAFRPGMLVRLDIHGAPRPGAATVEFEIPQTSP